MNSFSTDSDDVEIWIRDSGEKIKFWTDYQYNSAFLTPTDKFVFKVEGDQYVREYKNKIKPGVRISLVINGKTQCSGFVDSIKVQSDRSNGRILTIEGRDTLAPVVDAGIDPLYSFTTKSTLNDVIEKVIKPFGLYRVISTTDIANRSVITGNLDASTRKLMSPSQISRYELALKKTNSTQQTTEKVTPVVLSEYDPTKPKFLKDIQVDQVKPHEGEGCFEFLAKLARRFRLWIWASAIGDELIVAPPDFAQKPLYQLVRNLTFKNFKTIAYEQNVESLPTVVFATGAGAGGAKPYSKLKVAMVDEFTGVDSKGNIRSEVRKLIQGRKGFKLVDIRKELMPLYGKLYSSVVKPMYLHDDESRTFGQLEGFVLHQLTQKQSEAMTIRCKVAGHTQNGKPWAVNTLVALHDDEEQVYGNFWIKERTFSKSRQGTETDLTLIPPYALML